MDQTETGRALGAAKTHWYLAGPMSGVPQFNVPLFDAVTAELREQGFTVTSPAELDSEAVRNEAMAYDGDPSIIALQERGGFKIAGETWGEILARDVQLIADTDIAGIALLPGWNNSRGARLECFVGLLHGDDFKFAVWADEVKTIIEVPNDYVKEFIL